MNVCVVCVHFTSDTSDSAHKRHVVLVGRIHGNGTTSALDGVRLLVPPVQVVVARVKGQISDGAPAGLVKENGGCGLGRSEELADDPCSLFMPDQCPVSVWCECVCVCACVWCVLRVLFIKQNSSRSPWRHHPILH